MLKNFHLVKNLFLREFRSGDWAIIFFALTLAVSAITAVHFYTDRLFRGYQQQSAHFLGGDLAISSMHPVPEIWINKAKELNLRTAEVLAYPSVISTSSHLQLVNIQAVSANYPLVGNYFARPPENSIFVEPRLLSLLSTKINDNVIIGTANFKINKLLTSDINSLNTGFIFAPKIMMRLEDAVKTNTVIPGSQVEYRFLIAGNQEAINKFREWIKPLLKPGERLLDINNQFIIVKNILKRADNYLQLVLLFCVMLSAIAIVISVQHFLRHHFSDAALMRCLGARQAQMTQLFLLQLILIALLAGFTGIVIGFLAQSFFVGLFSQFFRLDLPPSSMTPLFLGFFISLLLAITFAYPIISDLPKVSPLLLWRGETAKLYEKNNWYFVLFFLIIIIFLYWFTDFSLLTLLLSAMIMVSIGVLYAISLLLLSGIKMMLPLTKGSIRRGLSQLIQYPQSASLQIICFSLIFIAMITLTQTREKLNTHWQQSLPANTPNYFIINIAPEDVVGLQQLFDENKIKNEKIYPLVKGRLIGKNGQNIFDTLPKELRTHNALNRELNLSWMWDLPKDNSIVAGKPWVTSVAKQPLLSVEQGLAEELHLRLGDELTFQIGEQTVSGRIYNFRRLNWTSFHPNFYVIFFPGILDDFPATYITSIHLSAAQNNFLNSIIQKFPNVTIIDIANILQQIQDLVDRLSLAIKYLFLFALLISILVLIASVQASADERRQTYQIMRILGADKKFILKSLIVEWGFLVTVILITAVLLAKLISWVIEKNVF